MQTETKPSVIVFDVNETLLDIDTLKPLFERIFGDGQIMRDWFAQLILYSEAISLAGLYAPFSVLGAAVLKMVAETRHIVINDEDVAQLRYLLGTMPVHLDVRPGLVLLKQAGFSLVTLTNSAPDPKADPLERAGISDFFEQRFSVDSVKRFKPAPEAYQQVARVMQVQTSAMCLVAAHTWDTLGAQALGCKAALITRPGNAPILVAGFPQPQVVGANLEILARSIIERWC